MAKVKLAVIGCGGFVRSHLRAISDGVPEFRVVALCDVVRERAEAHRKEFFARRRVAVHTDHREMLAEVQPEAVIVSTPHTLHFRHCFDALSAGAHVMVEKPMVTNARHARRLVRKAEKAARVLQIAIQGTYTDTFAYARRLLSDGTMGELQLVTAALAQDWLNIVGGSWRTDPGLSGGGQLYDSMAHVLSAMMYLVDSPVREVFCWTDKKGCEVDVNAVGCIKFVNGAMASITSGGNSRSWLSHLYLQGTEGLMEVSPHGGDFRVTRGAPWRDPEPPIVGVPDDWDIPTVAPVRNFADAILHGQTPRCGGRMGILLADLMDALYESAATGKAVTVQA